MQERDDDAHRVDLAAKGMEQKGKGAATATVTSWLEPDGTATRVKMEADITLTGAAAQLSRGLLPEISKKLTQQFADCLHENIVARRTERRCGRGTRSRRAPARTAPRGEAGRGDRARPLRHLVADRRVLQAAVRRRSLEAVT